MIRSSLSIALVLLLVACSSTPGTVFNAGLKIADQSDQAKQTLESQKGMSTSLTSVAVRDDLWVGGGAIQLSDRDVLPDFFNRQATFYQLDPVSFQEIVSRLSAEFGTRIVLSPDAIDHLRGLESEGDEDRDMNNMAVNSPNDVTNVNDIIGLSGRGLVGSKVEFTLQHVGTVASLLDLVTNKANLFWRWEKTHIMIYRNVTKTFVIDSLPGKSSFSASVESGGSGVGEQGARSLSSHATEVAATPESAWESLAKSVATMMSNEGRFALSEQVGTLTVTDTPPVVEEIASYVKSINGMMGRKIGIRTEVYEVLLENDGSMGIDWDVIFKGWRDLGVTLATEAGGVAPGVGMNIIRNTGRFAGSSAMIDMLSQYTDLSLVTSSSVFTTNGQPVPVQVVDETTYLASIQRETSAEGGLSQTSMTPGVVTSGISMSLVPRVESDGDIMMQVAMDLSQLNGITSFGNNDAQIQLPSRSSKNFLQRVSLRSGETLMVSGFERTETTRNTSSMGGRHLWFLGGKTGGGERKVMTLVLITPYLMAR